MSDSCPPPSIGNLCLLAAKIILAAISRLLTAPIRWNHWNGAPVLYKDVFFAGIRAFTFNLTIAQARYLNKSTTETYQNLCKEIKQEPKTLCLKENDTTAHWIGKEDADIVILYLHGGGYIQPCTPEHMQYLHRLVTDMNNLSGGTPSVSVLLSAYTLVPEATFPSQLKQASAILSYLVKEGKRSAASIMISGDSAGGGLVISLLSHLLHPHLNMPPLTLQTPLRGAFVYSPWVSFDTSHDSFARNAVKDCLVPKTLRKWSGMYLGTVDGEYDPGVVIGGNNYSEPLLANPSWWEGMHNVVDSIFIWSGEDEVFVDSIRLFGVKFLKGWEAGGGVKEKVKLNFAENDAHIGPIMDVMLQYKEKSKSQLGLEEWFMEHLSKDSR